MTNFNWRLDNKQIATLATYVRGHFGKLDAKAAGVSAGQVADLRSNHMADKERQ